MTIITTASGLQYDDIKVGDGAEAKAGQNVTVHYTGWLRNDDGSKGPKFDSSKDRNDPFEFDLGAGHVIKGWDEGVQGMQEGGTRVLVIPPALETRSSTRFSARRSRSATTSLSCASVAPTRRRTVRRTPAAIPRPRRLCNPSETARNAINAVRVKTRY